MYADDSGEHSSLVMAKDHVKVSCINLHDHWGVEILSNRINENTWLVPIKKSQTQKFKCNDWNDRNI